MNDHIQISYRITSNKKFESRIESIIWYGSSSKGKDLHPRSDCDIQIIIDKPDIGIIKELGVILEDYPHVDISILYLSDIFSDDGSLKFQSGSKGLFFIHVLNKGKVLFGKNVYEEIASSVTMIEARASLLFTTREYLSRLRIMATHSPNDTMKFKKYSLKFFLDILVLKNIIPLSEIGDTDYKFIKDNIQNRHNFREKSRLAIKNIDNFTENYTKNEMAELLFDYEKIMESIKV